MYEAHWNLVEKPFENDQNLKYFYESKNHKEALVRILYATEQAKPLAIIMGEHGSGKTFVCRNAAGELKKRGYRAAILTAPSADPAELYRRASEALGILTNEKPIETRYEFVRACRPTDPADTKRTVLFVDNIDSITDERILGEIRTLLDVTLDDGKPLFTIVLSGTPRARDTMRRHPSLVQRIEVGYDLAPLGEEDARNYVLHRLRISAGPKRIFDNAALRGAYKASSGLPRLLNRVCDLALLIGKIEAKDQILRETVDQAADEVRELGVLGAGRPPVGVTQGEQGRPDGRRPDRRDDRGRDRDRPRGDRPDRRGEPAPAGAPAAAAPAAGGEEAAEDSYVFNPDEHKDIESMSEIIQGSLKVVSGGPQRRRRGSGKRKERGEFLDYFGAATSEEGHVEEEGEDEGPETPSDERTPIPEHHEPSPAAEREADVDEDEGGADEGAVPEVIRTYSPSDERGERGPPRGDRGGGGGAEGDRRRGRRGRRGRGRGRDDRPRDDRPRDDRPRDDRPRDDRPRDDRPREDRPRDDRPREDRPRDDRPREPREDRPREDRPREPREDRPREDRPREPREDRPRFREDRPREDRPREDRPREETHSPRPMPVVDAAAPAARPTPPPPPPPPAPSPMDLGDFASGLLSSDQVARADEQRQRDAERATRAREDATRRASERKQSEERKSARERESEADTGGFASGILDAPPGS